jgi:hypothetical protein
MHLQLVHAPEHDQRRERDRAARAPVEPRPRPDLPPGVARDQVLEVGGEVGRAGDRGVHVLVAEDLAPSLHAALVGVVGHARPSP